ncbi:MAG: vitamin K epoxide reductase family protein [Streptosporangiaceae bacterium]
MTASKSTRARNARAAAKNGTASRGGTAATTRTAGQGGTAAGTGTADRAAAGTGTTAKNGTAAKNGSARTGTAVRNGSGVRDDSRAANGGTAVRARPGSAGPASARAGSARADAASRTGRGDRGDVRAQAVEDQTATTGPSLWLQIVTFLLAIAGLGVSTYLTIAHFTQSTLAGCSETAGLVNCTKVTTSAQSYVFGIPVAVLGMAFYVFVVAIMSPWAWRAQRREIHLARIAAMIAGVGFVIYLLYAELFIIGNICLYCTSVHVITFVLFVLTMFAVAAWGLRPGAPFRRSPQTAE